MPRHMIQALAVWYTRLAACARTPERAAIYSARATVAWSHFCRMGGR